MHGKNLVNSYSALTFAKFSTNSRDFLPTFGNLGVDAVHPRRAGNVGAKFLHQSEISLSLSSLLST